MPNPTIIPVFLRTLPIAIGLELTPAPPLLIPVMPPAPHTSVAAMLTAAATIVPASMPATSVAQEALAMTP